MSDTRVATKPYIIGPAHSSFVVPATAGVLTPPTVNADAGNKGIGIAAGAASFDLSVQKLTLNTGSPNLIVAYIWANTLTGSGAAVSVNTVVGGTVGSFTNRSARTFHTTLADAPYITLEVWYKTGSFLGLLIEDVTTTFNGTFDNAGMCVIGYDGVGATPFTASGSFFANDPASNGTIPTVSGVNIAENGTLAFGFAASASNVATGSPSADTGWSSEFGFAAQIGTDFTWGTMEDKTFTTSQTGITVQFGSAFNRGWLMTADAIVGT